MLFPLLQTIWLLVLRFGCTVTWIIVVFFVLGEVPAGAGMNLAWSSMLCMEVGTVALRCTVGSKYTENQCHITSIQ